MLFFYNDNNSGHCRLRQDCRSLPVTAGLQVIAGYGIKMLQIETKTIYSIAKMIHTTYSYTTYSIAKMIHHKVGKLQNCMQK